MDIKTTKQPDGHWVAIDADNYEPECGSTGWWCSSPAGYGRTETEAIRELLAEIEDRAHGMAAIKGRAALAEGQDK